MPVPDRPKIYHIVHFDRLPSIVSEGCLWCDTETRNRALSGTSIGMKKIKRRRLSSSLESYPDLRVGMCVPFYFCPRSVMLYAINEKHKPGLEALLEPKHEGSMSCGQDPIVHLEAGLLETIKWAEKQGRRWVFTLSNAGAAYFEDRCDLRQLGEIDWDAVQAKDWRKDSVKKGKQSEFLVEHQFPWDLVSQIGVQSRQIYHKVVASRQEAAHKPIVSINKDWYY